MVVVDTNFLVLMIDPDSTQNANREADRVRKFIEDMTQTGEAMVVPAPSLAELVAGRVHRIDEITEVIRQTRVMNVQEFDSVIAIETGDLITTWQARIPPAERLPGWKPAMKYDAMVAATALVRGARAIVTTDMGFGRYLDGRGVEIVRIDRLPLPPENPQSDMFP